jgi:hypothetical protein
MQGEKLTMEMVAETERVSLYLPQPQTKSFNIYGTVSQMKSGYRYATLPRDILLTLVFIHIY